MADYHHTDGFRGASFTEVDLTGARFRGCDLRKVKIVDSWLVDLDISGMVGNLIVNDVDVTGYVQAELDRRYPERAQVRQMADAEECRAAWDTVERLWSQTVERARRLPEAALHERVDGEWSFVETLRHLVYVTESWAARTVLDQPMPFHRIALTHTEYPAADAAALGMDADARPSLAEVLAVLAERRALVGGILDDLTDSDLDRTCTRSPAPGYPEEPRSVRECLRVVMDEECEHRRYAVRDLAVLRTRHPGGDAAT